MPGKTQKAFAKRVKITGRGKLFKRHPNQNHFNSRESGNSIRGKRGSVEVPKSLTNAGKHLL